MWSVYKFGNFFLKKATSNKCSDFVDKHNCLSECSFTCKYAQNHSTAVLFFKNYVCGDFLHFIESDFLAVLGHSLEGG